MAVKLTVNMSDEAAMTLKNASARNRVSVTEQLRRSLATELWLEEVLEQHGKILVEKPSGQIYEVKFQW